ncbi:hypothetical protein [Clostridium polynesiense]|uniref:hypothetical protein n=1 Tax=Clostridium polynesiense TaxID=1325933 RepID=UPI0012E0A1B4|nr:hypothetical protein [Clostridium polynesiense]
MSRRCCRSYRRYDNCCNYGNNWGSNCGFGFNSCGGGFNDSSWLILLLLLCR